MKRHNFSEKITIDTTSETSRTQPYRIANDVNSTLSTQLSLTVSLLWRTPINCVKHGTEIIACIS